MNALRRLARRLRCVLRRHVEVADHRLIINLEEGHRFAERIDTAETELAMLAAGVPRRCPDCSAEWRVLGHGAVMGHELSCPHARQVTGRG